MAFNKHCFVLLVIYSATISAREKRDNLCYTPNGVQGICTVLSSCDVIKRAFESGDASAKEFARQSTVNCGFDEDHITPLVCCGQHGTFAHLLTTTTGGYNYEHYTTAAAASGSSATKDKHTETNNAGNGRPVSHHHSTTGSDSSHSASNHNGNGNRDRDNDSPSNATLRCGTQIYRDHRYEGSPTSPGEFPWIALLRYKDKNGHDLGFQCTGTLIDKRYVLTAAHCVARNVQNEMDLSSVRLGEQNVLTDPDCRQLANVPVCADKVVEVDVSEVIAHPAYHSMTKNNDIALLRLAYDIQFTDYISPICLPRSGQQVAPQVGELLVIAGWGVSTNGTRTADKRSTQVPIVSIPDCKSKLQRHNPRAKISGNNVCAGGVQGQDACRGDSGGPLMAVFKDDATDAAGKWYQEAVISWGVGCGFIGYPGVYTRVSRYTRWIGQILSETEKK